MKILPKTKAILISTKAETMVEVIVAFLVMSIVMVLFAQGLRYATSAQTYAIDNGRACDKAMIELHKTVSGAGGIAEQDTDTIKNIAVDNQSDVLQVSRYTVNMGSGDYFVYWVFDAKDA